MLHKNSPKNVKIRKVSINGKLHLFIFLFLFSSLAISQDFDSIFKNTKESHGSISSEKKLWNPTKFLCIKASQTLLDWTIQWWYSTRITHFFFNSSKNLPQHLTQTNEDIMNFFFNSSFNVFVSCHPPSPSFLLSNKT